MARSTWSQRCCTATSAACSCTSAGRSASCSSSPWCPPPASPATTPCNQTQPFGFQVDFLEGGGKGEEEYFYWLRLLPCLLEGPSTPHCFRRASPQDVWWLPSARPPPPSAFHEECRCTPPPQASIRRNTRARCIFRPILYIFHFSLGKGKESG